MRKNRWGFQTGSLLCALVLGIGVEGGMGLGTAAQTPADHTITAYPTITTIAGDGEEGDSGNGGPATSARLNSPQGISVDGNGNIYIADMGWIRKVDGRTGIITRPAEIGAQKIFVDDSGNIFTAAGGLVSRVDRHTGVIEAVAGGGGGAGDGGLATKVHLKEVFDVHVDAAGDIYFSEMEGGAIRKVDGRTGIISTVAGNGEKDLSGLGGPAVDASFGPRGIFIDVFLKAICHTSIIRLKHIPRFHLAIGA